MATRWMVAGRFAFALASPVRAVDSLDAIRADLANCKGPPSCLHRTLLQARLNYRLKMIQMAEVTMGSIASSVPGASADLRRAVAGVAGTLAGNAGSPVKVGPGGAVPANARPTAVSVSPAPATANPNPAPPAPRPSAARPTPAAPVQNRAAGRAIRGTWPLQVALSEAISADALNSGRDFRALSLVPVMSGGRMIVPRGVMVYLKVRALGPGAQPNSLRLALAVDYAEFNGTRVPLASNEVERVIFTASGGRPRPGFPSGLGVNTRLPFAVSPATAASPER
ncbi:MAG: hypothetical protein DMG58_21375 [Acidobacteria bacterium]|nr:MAG: hypothetical protein DMG58_21375 [Acidobacteriota bacterium]